LSNIIEIQINKREVPNIAYDKIYFVPKTQRDIIPNLFRFALVLPVTGELLRKLKEVKPHFLSTHTFLRDDETKNIPIEADGRKKGKSEVYKFWDNFFEEHDLHNRVAVIPILTVNTKNGLKPQYLTAQTWFRKQGESYVKAAKATKAPKRKRKVKPALPDLAYLSTPYDEPYNVIQPICTICPMALQNLAGECTPGQMICYESLNFDKASINAES
jgi:hypothetical protein